MNSKFFCKNVYVDEYKFSNFLLEQNVYLRIPILKFTNLLENISIVYYWINFYELSDDR